MRVSFKLDGVGISGDWGLDGGIGVSWKLGGCVSGSWGLGGRIGETWRLNEEIGGNWGLVGGI